MSAIIFDFDGTIADSRDYFIEFIAKEAGVFPLTKEQEEMLHGLSLMSVARTLGISWLKLPNLYFNGRKQMDHVIKTIKPFAGISEVLRKLHNEGHELFIVSSNSVKNIRVFLKQHHLQEYFIEIYGGVEVFGKASMLHQLLRENDLKVDQTVSVGDETRDIEASMSVGMRTVAVTWGFARETDLEALKPSAICKTPNDLLATLELV
jgi:phosphoglycolate phosphatase-like HAD superfamily hydrolase